MYRNYLKIAFRNLLKNKASTLINIGGLAVGMAVAMLIGLWIWDELSYDRYHANYEQIAQVMQHNVYNGVVETQVSNPAVMAEEIRDKYGSDFKYVLQSSWNFDHTLAYQDKKLLKPGSYFEPQVTEMLSLKMLRGTRDGLKEPYTILLSAAVAKAFFGEADPMGKMFKIDNQVEVKVTGVYEDLPLNSTFRELSFILPWQLYLISNPWVKEMEEPWGSNFTQTFAQIANNTDMATVSAKIKNVKLNRVSKDEARYKPVVFLHPMSKWHLYEEFKEGKNIGGRIQTLWLFGIIGIFVLLLACINFMNLSTARSEKRAKEVGIRKSIGSLRTQLVTQFFSESLLVALFAFVFSIVLVLLMLPFFNEVADKKMAILWSNPLFWSIGIVFSLLTGLIAGTYPAFYLSSFQPLKVLKGTFRVGRWASVPRKVLVVLQFTVSITLIIGTIIVFRQIEYAKNRPIGYERDGLVYSGITEPIHAHFEAINHELQSSGAIVAMTGAGSPTTEVWNTNGGFNWEGKDPNLAVDFPNNAVTHDYGKTVGWKIKAGRDFSREFATDTAAFILNESAVKFIGFKDPIGSILEWNDEPFRVIGVVEDLLVQSPYQPVRPSLFHIETGSPNVAIMKINPELSPKAALGKIQAIFAKNDPASVFEFQFIDEEYAQKFGDEVRTGKLATFFAILAIFISCLGLFGLASFVAEQRTKEIGVRKVLGATILSVWGLLSKEFVALVLISCVLAIPLSWYYLNGWLQQFEYRTNISWWIFAAAVVGALLITLLTVSYQAIRAAVANPVKSLRSE
ncbi:FtsX-like permease family protein [Haliscomenobacter sp.]|uniref:ABC transporter permease n=1 Tax=Haliscomenobacter sp. TaxID=2717303 RepID=UPI003BAAC7C1